MVASTVEGGFMLTTRSAAIQVFLVLFLALAVAGCNIAGGIFKAGFWSGIILVVVIAVGLMFLVAKMRG
jgi:hypothetical protein